MLHNTSSFMLYLLSFGDYVIICGSGALGIITEDVDNSDKMLNMQSAQENNPLDDTSNKLF